MSGLIRHSLVAAVVAVALIGFTAPAPISAQAAPPPLRKPQRQRRAGRCSEAEGLGHAAHRRRQARSAGQLDQRDADAARAHDRDAAARSPTRRPPRSRSARWTSRCIATRRAIRTGRRRRKAARRTISRAPGERSFIEQISEAAGGAVGGYNGFWLDPGLNVIRIDGVARSSIIIDPPSGRVPALTDAGKKRLAEIGARARKFGEFDHPEMRPLADRCLRVVRIERRSADAAELLLQQQLHHRADQGSRDDPERDGQRRAHHPHRRHHAPAEAHHQVVRRLDRPLGRRHAGGRDHQHSPDAARIRPASCGRIAARRRT